MKRASLCLVLFSLATASAAQAAGALEIVPSLGLGKMSGNGSSNFDVGVGVGLSVGGRLHPNFSLAGQASYDGISPDVQGASGVDVSAYMLQFRVLPAFHYAQGTVDFSIGPTLGLFYMNLSAEAGGQSASASIRGFQLGFLSSLLFEVHPAVSIGPYFSWGRLLADEACQEQTGVSEQCDSDPENDDEGFWSLGVAARF